MGRLRHTALSLRAAKKRNFIDRRSVNALRPAHSKRFQTDTQLEKSIENIEMISKKRNAAESQSLRFALVVQNFASTPTSRISFIFSLQ